MQIHPYLGFTGKCEEALNFYEECLGGKIDGLMKFAGSPAEAHVPAGWGDKVLHARLVIDGNVIMASDGPRPSENQEPSKTVTVSLGLDDLSRAEKIFQQLSQGGTVQMAFQPTFWAKGFGMCTDRFGIPWMVNCE